MRSKHETSAIAAFLFISVVIIGSSFVVFSEIDEKMNDLVIERDRDTLDVGNVSSSLLTITDDEVDELTISNFNPEFKLVRYERIQAFPLAHSINTISGVVDEARMMHGLGLYWDTFLLKNGTLLVFNTTFTSPDALGVGANYTPWFSQDVSAPGCTIEQYMTYGTRMFVYYKNSSMTDISVQRFDLDDVNGEMDSFGNVTIHQFSSTSAVNLYIKDVESDSTYGAVCGYYDNSTNDVPFFYTFTHDLSNVVDCLQGNSSLSYLQNFGNGLFRLLDTTFTAGTSMLMSDEKILQVSYPPTSYNIYTSLDLVQPLDYKFKMADITKMAEYSLSGLGVQGTGSLYYRRAVAYVEYSLSPLSFTSYSISSVFNVSSGTYAGDPTYTEKNTISLETSLVGTDNVFTAFSDLSKGILYDQSDMYLTSYAKDTITTTQAMTPFDFFIPFDTVEVGVLAPGNGSVVRSMFGSGQSIWVAQFSSASVDMFDIGNSKVDFALCDRAYITHDAGTKYFTYKLSGKIERNVTSGSEIVEIGVMPMYIGSIVSAVAYPGQNAAILSDTNGDIKTMLNEPVWNRITGFRVIQVQNFIGFGNRFIDFTVEFDSEFLGNTSTFNSYSFVDIKVNMLVYERYANGTYTQRYLNTYDSSMRFFITSWDFDLQTSIVLQDSHLLDELHVFVGGQEFDPYRIVFNLPFTSLLITDKYTLDVLYNESSVIFSDPVVVDIPAKYEFFISYFSTLDKFGFPFDLVSTFVNGTQVSNEFVRVLSPDAEIVVEDFAGSVLKTTVVNRFVNGSYIRIGLDIAQVIISNQFTNTTIDFYLTKEDTTIYYQLPSMTSFILRLALGDYHYKVKDAKTGEVLFDEDITIDAAITLSFGFYDVQVPTLPPQGYTFLDTILSAAIFAGIVFIVMIGYNMGYFKRIKDTFVTTKKRT